MGPRKDCNIEPQVAKCELDFPNSLPYREELACGWASSHSPPRPPLAITQTIIS